MPVYDRNALIADSNPDHRERAALALGSVGFDCDVAVDGEQALAMCRRTIFDLLVVDLVLPKIHGHSVIVQAQQLAPPPKTVVWTSLTDPRLVRDVLARGVEDYLHKSTPDDLFANKLLALFELEAWRNGQAASVDRPEELDEDVLLNQYERDIRQISVNFADRLAPIIERISAAPEIPPSLTHFASRLEQEEQAAPPTEAANAANVRGSQRVAITAQASAILVDDRFRPTDEAVGVLIRDLSATGVRLLHTRAIPAAKVVLAWQAQTIPDCLLALPLQVTRCRPTGRFYDIGGQFQLPTIAADEAPRRALVTN